MISQSLITLKISELACEAQTGIKRIGQSRPMDAFIADTVTLSADATLFAKLNEATNAHDDTRAAFVKSVQEKIASGRYTVTDEMAEKIARKILGIRS
jgi:anti-sigma28 factor (negative regulator of flagellin synthesis)